MLTKINLSQYLTIALSIAIFTTPLGVLTIKGWAGYHLFICAFLSLTLLWTNRQRLSKLDFSNQSQIRIIAWVLALPFLATLTAQILRNEFNLSALDSPARFILAISILYGLIASKINIAKLLAISIPTSVITTYLLIPYLPQKGWALDNARLATYSVDPLTFGNIALGLGLMSALIAIECRHRKLILMLAVFGIILGIHMSIESQSRTGWLSVFLVILFLVIHLFRKTDSIKKKVIGSVILSICLLTPFLTNPQVLNRVSQAVHEIKVWQPSKDNADTSVGMRLSFWKIGAQLFIEKPITGWGNDGFKERLAQPDFREMASQFTRDFTLSAGFHSDIMQNAVRSGLGGLIAYLSIFLAPLAFFIRLYLKSQSSQLISGLAIIYVCVELISSLSTEVLSLKSTASLYGLMIVFLAAGSINMKTQLQK
jgi:O-antigen ligase